MTHHGPVPEPDGPPSGTDPTNEQRIKFLELKLKRTNEDLRHLSDRVDAYFDVRKREFLT